MSVESVNEVEIQDISSLKKQSMWSEAWRRLKQSPTAMFGFYVLTFILIAVIVGPFFIDKASITKQVLTNRFQPMSTEHFFGTDSYGRDTFARILYGGRTSLLIGFGSAFLSLITGGIIGLMVGYYGGKFDNVVMRFVDVIASIPPILLALAIVAALGSNMRNLMIAITISSLPGFIRVIRSSVLTVADSEYIEAAHAGGTSDARIIFKHVLPNVMGTVIVQTTMSMSKLLLQAATLSFLGLGIQQPNPEWGAMLSEAREFMRTVPMLMMYPGVAIVMTTLSLNLLGDGLRDAFDPRLRS